MRAARWIDGVPLLLGAWIALGVVGAWAGRFAYPYDLEWMEGGMLAHAWRLQHGLPLFQEPDADWIPYIYPPGYPALLALLGSATGLSLTLGRAVSLAGTLAACAATVFVGWRQGSAVAGLLGALVFVACYPNSGAFYDLVRPDALGAGLFAWSIALGLEPDRRARLASALLLATAFTVKHNFASFGIPMALGIWAMRGWREAFAFGATAALPALAFTIALELGSAPAAPWWAALPLLAGPAVGAAAGWARGREAAGIAGTVAALFTGIGVARALEGVGHFQRTLLGIPGAHPMVEGRLVPGSVEELGGHLGLALAACTLAFVAGTARIVGRRGAGVWIAGGLGALAAQAGLLVPDLGGLLPVHPAAEAAAWGSLGAAVLAGFVGLGLQLADRRVEGRWMYGFGVAFTAALVAGLMRAHHGGFTNVFIPLHWVIGLSVTAALVHSRRVWSAAWVGPVGALLVTAQLASKRDADLDRLVPDEADRAVGDAFVEALRDCDGPVWSPFAPWLAAQAGHAPSFHLIALWDVNHRASPYRVAVDRVAEAAAARHWACIVDGSGRPLGHGVPKHYEPAMYPGVPPRGARPPFMPKTGWRVRPRALLRPIEP